MPACATRHLVARDLRRQSSTRRIGPYSLTIHSGECVLLSGPSGSGKTLLLRMLADLDPHQGEACIIGSDQARAPLSRAAMSAAAWRQRVTYVAAESGWWADTLGQHLSAALQQEAATLLNRLGLPATLLQAPIDQLSSGERQRCALLRAVLQKPQFLLLDEPSSALDETSTQALENLLQELQRSGTGLLLVSHQPAQVQRLADRILHMHDAVLSGPTA